MVVCFRYLPSLLSLLPFFAGNPIGCKTRSGDSLLIMPIELSSFLHPHSCLFIKSQEKSFTSIFQIIGVTGLLQFLRYDSLIRIGMLDIFKVITLGKSNLFPRTYTSSHFSNPFNTPHSQVVYVPVGIRIPYFGKSIEVLDFPISTDFNFKNTIGNCELRMKTLSKSTVTRVTAPWGPTMITFNMQNDNLAREVNYGVVIWTMWQEQIV